VVNQKDIEALLRAGTHVGPLAPVVRRVCSESTLGQKLFGWAQARLTVDEFSRFVVECVEKYAAGPSCQRAYDEALARCKGKADELDVDAVCPEPREVQITYAHFRFPVLARHAMEEVELQIAAAVKWLAVRARRLTQLHFERAVLGVPPLPQPVELPWPLVNRFEAARAVGNEKMSVADSDTGTVLSQLFRLTLPTLVALDSSFKIEYGLCACLSSGPGEQALWEEVHSAFPDAQVEVSLSVTRQRLEALLQSALYKFCSAGAQSLVRAVLGQVRRADGGHPPEFREWSTSERLKEVMRYFDYYVRAKQGDAVFFGAKALEIEFQALKAKVDAKAVVPISATKLFATFEYLAPQPLRGDISKLCCAIVETAARGLDSGVRRAASSNEPASSSQAPALKRQKSKAAQKQTETLTGRNVLDLFA
jgi:hypothetical protein